MRPSIAPGRSATSVTAHNDSAWASLTSKQANLWTQEFLKRMGSMGRPSRFSPEVRARAVRMVEEHREGPRVGVGGAAVGGAEARVHGGDAAEVGAAGAA